MICLQRALILVGKTKKRKEEKKRKKKTQLAGKCYEKNIAREGDRKHWSWPAILNQVARKSVTETINNRAKC
jgi:hypothetical protein